MSKDDHQCFAVEEGIGVGQKLLRDLLTLGEVRIQPYIESALGGERSAIGILEILHLFRQRYVRTIPRSSYGAFVSYRGGAVGFPGGMNDLTFGCIVKSTVHLDKVNTTTIPGHSSTDVVGVVHADIHDIHRNNAFLILRKAIYPA